VKKKNQELSETRSKLKQKKKKRRRKMKKNLVQSRTLAGPTDRVIRIDKGQCTGSFSKRRKKRSICADLYEMNELCKRARCECKGLRENHAWITQTPNPKFEPHGYPKRGAFFRLQEHSENPQQSTYLTGIAG
jgi:hypothetical protein